MQFFCCISLPLASTMGFEKHFLAFVHFHWTSVKHQNKPMGMPRIKPGSAEWEARMLPLCNAASMLANLYVNARTRIQISWLFLTGFVFKGLLGLLLWGWTVLLSNALPNYIGSILGMRVNLSEPPVTKYCLGLSRDIFPLETLLNFLFQNYWE